MGLFRKLRQRFCKHSWQMDRFQALTPGTGYTCAKCRKGEVFYGSRYRTGRKGMRDD